MPPQDAGPLQLDGRSTVAIALVVTGDRRDRQARTPRGSRGARLVPRGDRRGVPMPREALERRAQAKAPGPGVVGAGNEDRDGRSEVVACRVRALGEVALSSGETSGRGQL